MKPSLQLKMGQQLAMTPQLQQAIRLLQLSTLDLQHEIQEALESNPMLEAEDGQHPEPASSASNLEELVDFSVANSEPPAQEMPEWADNIPHELPVDTRWDEVYSNLPATTSADFSGHFTNEESDPLARSRQGDTLKGHLEWQLDMMPLTDRDSVIGLTITEATDSDGYLTCSLEDIYQALSSALEDLDIEEVQVVQRQIQNLDPVGCASQNLQECLLVQLKQLPETTPFLKIAEKLIENHLKALGSRDYAQIMRKGKIKEGQLREALKLIQSLNPKPGGMIDNGEAEYVIPDISVSRQKNQWVVELNSDSLPKLRINNNYASMVQRANTSRDNMFMKNHLQEARWFLKNLQSRNETLLKVASKIVSFQQAFFEEGEEAMKPLILADIAKAVDMHESTISRVTTQKYMHTPRGVYELKYFFSSHVGTTSGGEKSSTAIRALIKKLIAEENPGKPLSDNKIAALLKEDGINVARRTVAKYRESINLPPSNERKQLV